MGADINGLGFRMAAEIDHRGTNPGLTTQEEGDGGGARSAALQRLSYRALKGRRAVFIQELLQLLSLAARRFACGERGIQEFLGGGHQMRQAVLRGGGGGMTFAA